MKSRNSRKPVIGVTGPDKGGLAAWLFTSIALRRSHAKPVRITPNRKVDIESLDALVIGGGSDIEPFHYGQEPHPHKPVTSPKLKFRKRLRDQLISGLIMLFRILFAQHKGARYDKIRDELEMGLIQHALQHDLPVMGICRGAQLLNITLGGSLHQRLDDFYEETPHIMSVLPAKEIDVKPETCLAAILKTDHCFVNSLHNQSINELGDNVIISAKEQTGVVQAIEKKDHRFFIGVQWHPEYMPQSKRQLNLFQALARAAINQDTPCHS